MICALNDANGDTGNVFICRVYSQLSLVHKLGVNHIPGTMNSISFEEQILYWFDVWCVAYARPLHIMNSVHRGSGMVQCPASQSVYQSARHLRLHRLHSFLSFFNNTPLENEPYASDVLRLSILPYQKCVCV